MKPTKRDEADAEKWLRDNDLDYQKYNDRRGDRSAYDTLMNYEITDRLERAYVAGVLAERERAQGLVDALQKIADDKWCINSEMKSYDTSASQLALRAVAAYKDSGG